MKGMLEEIIKNKNYPNQHVKKLLTFPKIEALNAMHSKKTLLRGIKIQNLLIQQINKLYDVGLASVINILRSYKNSKKSLQSHFTYEVEKGFSRIQVKDHHQVFKLAILELDNQNVPQRQSILLEELTEHYQKKEQSVFDFKLSKNKINCLKKQHFKQFETKQTQSHDLFSYLTDFNCIKIKLLGGSEKQKIQACQLDDEQIQWNQNQNEDINSIRIEIEDKLLIEQIQNCISLFEHMQIQSDKKIEKSQQNENQQFYENKNQNQNQFKELINKKDNSKQKISEQDLTFRKGVNMDPKRDKVQKEVNIESSQNKNQNQNENQVINQNRQQKTKNISIGFKSYNGSNYGWRISQCVRNR
ncbi:hypothetical protein ABPG73_016977 [Tetrahymena malaccensis]